jgi:Uma2 family endonuclease
MSEAHALQSNTLAPWAEIVPGAEPATADDLLRLSDDGWRYEVVEGVLVRVAGSGDLATNIAAVILAALLSFVRPHRLGRVTSSDGVYRFSGAETGLIPDVGFYGRALFPRVVDRDKPIPFAPELAVEVASPSQGAEEMTPKVARYLRGGTRLVWMVWPHAETVDVWHPADLRSRAEDMRPSRTLRAVTGDLLDGEDVVPGFAHPVSDIFDV